MKSSAVGAWWGVGCIITASCLAGCNGRGGGTLPFTRPRSPEEKMERKIIGLSQANPEAQVASALKKGSRQFIAFFNSNWKVTVPGVPGDRDNSLVRLHGVKIITSASTRDDSQVARLAVVVESFGKRYNAALVKGLLSKPDAKTKGLLAQARAELQTFTAGKTTPQQAAAQVVKLGLPQFLAVTGETHDGVPSHTDPLYTATGVRTLKANALLMRGADATKFKAFVNNYLIPHNRSLYTLLKPQGGRKTSD